MITRDQIRKGSTEILILNMLLDHPMYGYEISQQLEQRSGGYFAIKEGLLYPTLHRMEQKGWLKTEWLSINGRRRKYYALTSTGRIVLDKQAAEWKTFLDELNALLSSHPIWTK